jgi:hypothetical protein
METPILVVEANGLHDKSFFYMTNTVNQWLMNAVSVPQTYFTEKYYYDYQQNELFVVNEDDANLLTVIENEGNSRGYTGEDIAKLTDKVSKISADFGVIEIPRLKLEERIAIQIDFISLMENFKFFEDFSEVINQQDQTQTFALDDLLIANKSAYLFIDYWAEFKTKQLAYFLNDFEDNHDINLQTVQIWDQSNFKRVS